MPRGKVRCTYVTDAGQSFWVWVDRDAQADPNRGWVLVSSSAIPGLARGWLPRRVVGVDLEGNIRYARIATTTALLWTGTVKVWTFEGSDRTLHAANVIGRQEEQPFG